MTMFSYGRPQQITAELREWQKKQVSDGRTVYWGRVYADKKNRWPDGRLIQTSVVVSTKDMGSRLIIKTPKSVYLLRKEHQAKENVNA